MNRQKKKKRERKKEQKYKATLVCFARLPRMLAVSSWTPNGSHHQ
jgi:hypothetical protein